MSVIRIFTVGGTIDKIYFDAKSSYEVGPPNITEVLSGLSLNLDYDVVSLMQKDSLEMTDEDRKTLREYIAKDDASLFIVTHGTDTMPETAAALQGLDGKTIVLTGALTPARFKTRLIVSTVAPVVMTSSISTTRRPLMSSP